MGKGYIYQRCKPCGGTGTETLGRWSEQQGDYTEEIECRTCGGNGKRPVAGLSDNLVALFDDMNDKINDIMDKCNDIFEKVNE